MQVSVPSFELGSPTVYTVVVGGGDSASGSASVTSLHKRFNDFVKLAADFEDELGEPLPVPLPPRQWFASNTAAFCEQRRKDLEVCLRALVRNVEYARALCVVDFLRLSQTRAPQDWLQLSGRVADTLSKAKAAQGTDRRKLCLEAKTLMAALRGHAVAPSENETARRKTVVEDLARQITALEARREDVVVAPVAPSSARVLGETDATRALGNAQLMAAQTRSMHDQDAEIEQLRQTLARQRALGVAIDDELQAQNALLEDLDAQVHHTNSRVNQAKRKTMQLN